MSVPPALTINGQRYEVGDVSPTTRLASFLHDHQLLGTHTTCYKGACGACIVVAAIPDPSNGVRRTMTINSCLVPVLACVGWELTTIEGLGNKYDGYHVIEERLTQHAGSQCGYCTPGMVMSMYGLSQSKDEWSAEDVEHQLDGTMCRCTGYRPILEAFKSLTPEDIEDAHKTRCLTTGKACSGCCSEKTKQGQTVAGQSLVRSLQLKDAAWHHPTSLQELLDTLAGFPEETKYTLIRGNTAQALYGCETYTEFIYTGDVPELSAVRLSTEELVFGGSVSITRLMDQLSFAAQTIEGYSYASQLVETWKYLGNTAVRNLGSWAGNLATKVNHHDFTSDIFVGLVAASAAITTVGPDGSTSIHTPEELLEKDLVAERRVILQLSFPPHGDNVFVRTIKVRPRTTTCLADVSAGFTLRVDAAAAHTVVDTPVIVFGGINPSFNRATATAKALTGKSLEDETVLQEALSVLASEVDPDSPPGGASPEYRQALTQTLLYKMVLEILGDSAGSAVVSGGSDLKRPVSSGQQTFPENTEAWPIGKPVTKIEAPIQCSGGEAEFITKIPARPGELFGFFITSTESNARLVSIDTTAALAVPGVVAVVTAEDIPGQNNLLAFAGEVVPGFKQPVFASERVEYYGQPIGLLVATNRGAAYAGRAAVKVTYEDQQPPVLTIEEALAKPLPMSQFPPVVVGDVSAGFAASSHIIEGAMRRGGQFHYHMETQVTVVNPTDNGFDVHSASQWLSETQRAISQVLDIPDNQVHVSAKRLGGGFGGKIDQCNIVSTATAVAAYKTRRPVRVQLDLADNMTIVGGREPYLCTYKAGVGFDDAGVLQAVQVFLTADSGYSGVDVSCPSAVDALPSCYSCPNWELHPQFILTNTPVTTWCRSPGTVEGVTFMENIMEHVAAELGVDPLAVRQKNLLPDGGMRRISKQVLKIRSRMAGQDLLDLPDEMKVPRNLISDMISQIMTSADVEQRKADVAQSNLDNRWKKRGLSVMPMLWPYSVPPVYPFSVMVAVNARDGSVSISHGGAEMGQGINTKVAQVAAYELGIPMDLISFVPSNVHSNPNSSVTGGSLGSDVCSYCVGEACKRIRSRLDTHQGQAGLVDPSWRDLVYSAFSAGVDISERYANGADEVKSYAVFGVACTEVELDVLTGQFIVLRSDILEDAGRSLSPLVDIGQVEGGFVMGQGLLTTEKVAFDSTTGKRLTDSVWTYHPPMALDIPADLRVSLLQDAPNPLGVQSSKVTSEPPLCLSFSVVMALRQAVTSARQDAGTTGWFQMDAPLTTERLQQLCLVAAGRLTLS
ncbi:Xanthine dehydrogenase [Chionoecetes opilio]|uniref:Xanthine dehydrogenase n=1 Tax=Chionoecetes opilio TaxID=41210 RepID=A0A8J4XNT7_CHIOP|nr:Xanthine dehydrogenase [Chionoecetes opilio]